MESGRKGEARLFFRRWLAHPLRVGALFPSGSSLATAVAKAVQINYRPGEYVVELGPGTGAVTRALMESGIPEDRLILVERDPDMVAWLRERFKVAQILQSDANCLNETLSQHGKKDKVLTVISSLPFSVMSETVGEKIIKAIFASLEDGGRMVQYTYHLSSPIPHQKLDLAAKRCSWVLFNFPPATVWLFSRKNS